MTYPREQFTFLDAWSGLSLPHALSDFLEAKLPWRNNCSMGPDHRPLMPHFTADEQAFQATFERPQWLHTAAAEHHAVPMAVYTEPACHYGYTPSKAVVGNQLLCNLTAVPLEVLPPNANHTVQLGGRYFPVMEFVGYCHRHLEKSPGPIEVIFFTNPQEPGMDQLVQRLVENIAVTGLKAKVALFTVPVPAVQAT